MARRNNSGKGHQQHPLTQETTSNDKRIAEKAHHQAERDMEEDAELSASNPNDDLDEGETARLGEETDLI
jgi:hypothetical protein